MPIPTRCPSCGNTAMIYEQYVGQTVPCQTCGQPMLVAGMVPGQPAPQPMPMPPPSSSGPPMLIIGLVVAVVALLVCGGILAAILLPAAQSARSAARRMQSQNNLKQLGLALFMYENQYQALPPAVVRDANGQPLYSGFVLLLPFLEQGHIFDRFKKDEPWNSPHNSALSQIPIPVFLDPAVPPGALPNRTDYQFVTGPGTMFEEGRTIQTRDCTDGMSNTIIFIGVGGNNRPWAAPGGWDGTAVAGPVMGNDPGAGVPVAFADGSVRTLRDPIDAATWRALSTRSGNEVIPPVN